MFGFFWRIEVKAVLLIFFKIFVPSHFQKNMDFGIPRGSYKILNFYAVKKN